MHTITIKTNNKILISKKFKFTNHSSFDRNIYCIPNMVYWKNVARTIMKPFDNINEQLVKPKNTTLKFLYNLQFYICSTLKLLFYSVYEQCREQWKGQAINHVLCIICVITDTVNKFAFQSLIFSLHTYILDIC